MPQGRAPLGLALLCALTLLSCVPAAAEDHHDQSTANIKDPRQLLLRAGKVNGLSGDDMKPWHLKVDFDFLDSSGKSMDHGTIEVLWAGPKMSKLVIRDASSKLTYTQTEKGMYREGELNEKLALLMLVEGAFVWPFPCPARALPLVALSQLQQVTGSDLRCVTVKEEYNGHGTYNNPTLCLESASPVLRMSGFFEDPHQFYLNKFGKFQNHYVPLEVTAGEGSRSEVTAHVELLQSLEIVDPAAFEPGSVAELQKEPQVQLVLPEGMLNSIFLNQYVRIVSHPQPVYPPEAKAANIRGTVRLRAWVGTDGHITSVQVINGPEVLRQAALDAVWRWSFDPPLHDGSPAQILTVLDVPF